jgi:hypothetical protein
MSKTTRTSVSVPCDLKRRMEAIGSDINWSNVACEAFERKISELEGVDIQKIDAKKMVIQALKQVIEDLQH